MAFSQDNFNNGVKYVVKHCVTLFLMPEKNADCRCAVQHYHGTTQCYRTCRCRKQECRDANAAAVRDLRRKKYYGTSTNHQVDATPVREHLEKLMGMGWGTRAITRETGISATVISSIIYGKKGIKSKNVREVTAATLLAFNPPFTREPRQGTSTAQVDATGSQRRLQALVALGFSLNWLAEYAGYGRSYFKQVLLQDKIGMDRARAVTEVYERLWNKKPLPETPEQKSSVTKAKAHARKNGWPPPMAWDDDKIDDPKHRPAPALIKLAQAA